MGLVKGRRGVVMVVFGNLVLVEAQALALSLLASVFAMIISLFDDNYSPSKILHILLFLGATSTAASSIAGFVLGTLFEPHLLHTRMLHGTVTHFCNFLQYE